MAGCYVADTITVGDWVIGESDTKPELAGGG